MTWAILRAVLVVLAGIGGAAEIKADGTVTDDLRAARGILADEALTPPVPAIEGQDETIGDFVARQRQADRYFAIHPLRAPQTEGFGLVVGLQADPPLVAVERDGPAARSGMPLLSFLEAAPGGIGDDEAAFLARLRALDPLLLTVRGVSGRAVSVSIPKGPVAATIRPDLHFALDGTVPVLRLFTFERGQTAEAVARRLSALPEHDVLVIDLRLNPGGSLRAALTTAGLFMAREDARLPVADRAGRFELAADAGPRAVASPVPVILLLSEHTASAAEVFARVMIDRATAFAIGTTTAGKCRAQKAATLPSGRRMRFTHLQLLTPGGETCQGIGLTPHVTVPRENLLDTDRLIEMGRAALEARQP